MGRTAGIPRPFVALLCASFLAAVSSAVPARAQADSGLPGTSLTGATVAVVLSDVDADGARELVRIVDREADPRALEVWDLSDGTWSLAWTAPVRSLAPDAGMPERTPATLLRARVAGTERVLVITGSMAVGDDELAIPQWCCLTIHELAWSGNAGGFAPLPVADVDADTVSVLDIEGDGTDELLASVVNWQPDDPERSPTVLALLGRSGPGWTVDWTYERDGPTAPHIGDTDGLPGDEVLVEDVASTTVERFGWSAGEIVRDRGSLVRRDLAGWIAGMAAGRIYVAQDAFLREVTWPSGDLPRMESRVPVSATAWIAVAGTSADAVVLEHEGLSDIGAREPAITVRDVELTTIATMAPSTDATMLWDLLQTAMQSSGWSFSHDLWPAFSTVPGQWQTADVAYLAGDRLIVVEDGEVAVHPVPILTGLILGTLGPGDEWVAVSAWKDHVLADTAHLDIGRPAEPRPLLLVEADVLLASAEALAGGTAVTGAIETADAPFGTVIAPADGFELVIDAPPGTAVFTTERRSLEFEGDVDGPMRLHIEPPRSRDDDEHRAGDEAETFERTVILLRPDGTVTIDQVAGTFLPTAPELTTASDPAAFSLSSVVSGEASPTTRVTVDGRPVAVDAKGAFRAEVDAPPWPRDVVVVARDPFGSESRTVVQVIGLVDYRGLPWAPILGVLTVAVGVALFVRTPRLRPEGGGTATLREGELEEIQLD